MNGRRTKALRATEFLWQNVPGRQIADVDRLAVVLQRIADGLTRRRVREALNECPHGPLRVALEEALDENPSHDGNWQIEDQTDEIVWTLHAWLEWRGYSLKATEKLMCAALGQAGLLSVYESAFTAEATRQRRKRWPADRPRGQAWLEQLELEAPPCSLAACDHLHPEVAAELETEHGARWNEALEEQPERMAGGAGAAKTRRGRPRKMVG